MRLLSSSAKVLLAGLLAASAPTAVLADSMGIVQTLTWVLYNRQGTYYASDASYYIDANQGCHHPNIPYMQELCIDYDSHPARAHFYFLDQPKRCMVITKDEEYLGSPPPDTPGYEGVQYRWFEFSEVTCTW